MNKSDNNRFANKSESGFPEKITRTVDNPRFDSDGPDLYNRKGPIQPKRSIKTLCTNEYEL